MGSRRLTKKREEAFREAWRDILEQIAAYEARPEQSVYGSHLWRQAHAALEAAVEHEAKRDT